MTASQGDAHPSVLIVDDHPVFRRGLALLLAEEGIDVVAQADTVAAALTAVAQWLPDVVIMDLHLPDGSGVNATRQILASYPTVRILILTMDAADAATLASLRAGARAYLLKEAAAESIVTTVFAVARGELILDSRVADRLAGFLIRPTVENAVFEELTSRELEVLALVAQGLNNGEVGRKLFLAEKTIRNHITGLLAKTGTASRPALIALARDRGLGGANRGSGTSGAAKGQP